MSVKLSKAPKISSLKRHQKMKVVYRSIGCFHNRSYIFEFRQNLVEIFNNNSINIKQKKIGVLYLSKKDIEGLDNLLQFYTKINMMNCTTINYINIDILIGPIALRKFSFTDSSCTLHKQSNILTFLSLLERLHVE